MREGVSHVHEGVSHVREGVSHVHASVSHLHVWFPPCHLGRRRSGHGWSSSSLVHALQRIGKLSL